MEKLIANCSYWLGVGCLVVALIWRTGIAVGVFMPSLLTAGHQISQWSFVNGSILFFLATVATVCHAWITSQKP